MSIPVSSSRVDLSLLHPRFKLRLEKFFEDPRIRGRVVVTSGCRSYAKQKYLYEKFIPTFSNNFPFSRILY